jgi:hypothetical protein
VRGARQHHAQAAVGGSLGARLLGIDQAVEGRVLLARDALAGVQHRIEGVARMLGKARTSGQRLGVQPVVQQEIQGGAQAWHALDYGRAAADRLVLLVTSRGAGRIMGKMLT